MKLGSIKDGSRDGRMVVVSQDLKLATFGCSGHKTLREALENWNEAATSLRAQYGTLNTAPGPDAFAFDPRHAAAPLPRANQWLDGSAFLNHGELIALAYKLERNTQQAGIPLMYQGACDDFIGPCDDIVVSDASDDIDFEGEIAAIVDDVPMGTTARDAPGHIKLVTIVNDVSLRAHGAREMRTGFGFIHGKPSSSFAPVAVTPDELGDAWRDGRLHLPLQVKWNGSLFGRPSGSEMDFNFPQLIEHAARTRRLSAATIVGSGTVSNADRSAGSATIAERRAIELLDNGTITTEYMRFGDNIRMEIFDEAGHSVFGAIDQNIRRN